MSGLHTNCSRLCVIRPNHCVRRTKSFGIYFNYATGINRATMDFKYKQIMLEGGGGDMFSACEPSTKPCMKLILILMFELWPPASSSNAFCRTVGIIITADGRRLDARCVWLEAIYFVYSMRTACGRILFLARLCSPTFPVECTSICADKSENLRWREWLEQDISDIADSEYGKLRIFHCFPCAVP